MRVLGGLVPGSCAECEVVRGAERVRGGGGLQGAGVHGEGAILGGGARAHPGPHTCSATGGPGLFHSSSFQPRFVPRGLELCFVYLCSAVNLRLPQILGKVCVSV